MKNLKFICSLSLLRNRYAVVLSLIMVSICARGECGGISPSSQGLIQGARWLDIEGEHINAHGGCVLFHDGKYYWFGEQRPLAPGMGQEGVNCYSSNDLTTWIPEGLALTVSETPGCDIERGCIIERPKVVYNKNTGKFVMWFHLELKGKGYGAARYGVAVSDTPVGPFTFLSSGRVNPKQYPLNLSEGLRNGNDETGVYQDWSPEWIEAVTKGLFVNRDFNEGQMSRDMTLFVDDDGKAYHIYSSEENLTLHIAELSDDYLSHTGKYIRVAPAGHNEAPMVMKADGKYWMVTSGCTGWKPNEARLFMSDSLMGEWEQLPNPCVGPKSEITFGGQGNFIFMDPVSGKHIAMFDIWNPECLGDSRHIWLPVTFEKGRPGIHWRQYWSF